MRASRSLTVARRALQDATTAGARHKLTGFIERENHVTNRAFLLMIPDDLTETL